MAYGNYLYNIRNIIGYTGRLEDCPTVYFQLGRAYGHITQNHSLPFNIGREEIAIHPNYHIDNHYIDGQLHAIEFEGRKNVHTSRNAFIRREFFRPGDLLTLSVALYRFPDLKQIYTVSHRQMVRKATVQDELLR